MIRSVAASLLPLALLACGSTEGGQAADGENAAGNISPVDTRPFDSEVIADFDEPWAMDFMPDTNLLFVTEKKGAIKFVDLGTGRSGSVESGIPDVAYGGQGGLGDILFAPDWPEGETSGGTIYLSWVESGEDNSRGAAVGRGTLICEEADSCRLTDFKTIWRQEPKTTGRGHFSHRLAISPDGKYLFVSSGERQKMQPAQEPANTLGTIVRLNLDGSVPDDNPYVDDDSVDDAIWSLGHRNVLGLAFDGNENLWAIEMGPKGGDELNLIERKANYGWPLLSDGKHYDGKPIPDHPERGKEELADNVPGGALKYSSPILSWVPSISPSSLAVYDGPLFPEWQGSLFVGALSGKALIRISLKDQKAEKADQWPMNARIREVEAGPDGALWLLEDGADGSQGRLLKLTPPKK